MVSLNVASGSGQGNLVKITLQDDKAVIAGPYERVKVRLSSLLSSPNLASKVSVDLRERIPDFSNNPFDYMPVLKEIIQKLNKYDIAAFGCSGGCGRTFTVLSLLIGYYSESEEEAFAKFATALIQRGMKCPETDVQRDIVALALSNPNKEGKSLRMWLALLSAKYASYVIGEDKEEFEKWRRLTNEVIEEPRATVYAVINGIPLDSGIELYKRRLALFNRAQRTLEEYRKLFDEMEKRVEAEVIAGLRRPAELIALRKRKQAVLSRLPKVVRSLRNELIDRIENYVEAEAEKAKRLFAEKRDEMTSSSSVSYWYGTTYYWRS